MIVTIDGPAGAGKSSVAKALALRLGFRFLDTGAMYRAVALAAMRSGHDWLQPESLVQLARALKIELPGPKVLLNGEDVSADIRTIEVTSVTHYAADNPGVREMMVQRQRQLAADGNVVSEGRDQGTVVFPEAECKIFLTATPEERARRRLADLQARGQQSTLADVLRQQEERDRRDTVRTCGPLVKAPDAVEVYTDGLSPTEVVDRLEALVRPHLTPAP